MAQFTEIYRIVKFTVYKKMTSSLSSRKILHNQSGGLPSRISNKTNKSFVTVFVIIFLLSTDRRG